jgi:hypothetical protein
MTPRHPWLRSIREPHWLYANNPKGEAIEWLDGAGEIR